MKRAMCKALAAMLGSGLLLLSGCGDQSTELSDGGAETADGDIAVTVLVTYKGSATAVDLAQPTKVSVNGVDYAKLSDVVAIAVTSAAVDQLQVTNILASDGFNPASKPNCAALLPLDGAVLASGYIDPATRNLQWDEALTYPGCMSVTDTAEILVADK